MSAHFSCKIFTQAFNFVRYHTNVLQENDNSHIQIWASNETNTSLNTTAVLTFPATNWNLSTPARDPPPMIQLTNKAPVNYNINIHVLISEAALICSICHINIVSRKFSPAL